MKASTVKYKIICYEKYIASLILVQKQIHTFIKIESLLILYPCKELQMFPKNLFTLKNICIL